MRRYINYAASAVGVPILTQSEDWALFPLFSFDHCSSRVPILTQSEDWALSRKQELDGLWEVSVPILTQSEDWALYNNPIIKLCNKVPILTQSEDWAL